MTSLYRETLEAKDVKFLAIEPFTCDGDRFVRVKGFVFHSALAVKEVVCVDHDDGVQILIRVLPTGPGLSGSFDTSVAMKDGRDRVTFGPSNHQIWP